MAALRPDRIRELIAVVTEEKVGIVASVTGATADDRLAPVNSNCCCCRSPIHRASEARVLGALAPLAAPYWLGAKAIGPLTLGMFRHIGGASRR